MRTILLLLFAAGLRAATPLSDLDLVFDRMYRHDFATALATVDEHIRLHPTDPLGYSVRGSVHLFGELDRLSILESEFFSDDKRITDKKKPKPDLAIRDSLLQSIGKARELALKELQTKPQDRNALFALCVAAGVQTDYLALIEKRQLVSLNHAKESQSWAVKLLNIDPSYHDAYLTAGVSEYLLGSMPFFVRWFVKFEQAEGSKTQAVTNLKKVAESGRYLRPFAKVLLAVIHLREKQPLEAEKQLSELAREFPENRLFRKELDKLTAKRSRGSAAAGRP